MSQNTKLQNALQPKQIQSLLHTDISQNLFTKAISENHVKRLEASNSASKVIDRLLSVKTCNWQ